MNCLSCARCPALCASRTQVVLPTVPRLHPVPLLCIGEAPGAEEDRQGAGFVGAAGKTLRRALVEAGLDIEWQVGFANIVRCRPEANRRPTTQEMRSCLPWLAQTLLQMRPRAVLLVGATAAEAFFGKRPLGRLVEEVADAARARELALAACAPDLKEAIAELGATIFAPMPHTSGLAWNRPSYKPGLRWSDVGRQQIARCIKHLEGEPTAKENH